MAKKTNADYKREQYQRKLERQALLGEKDVVTPIPASIWAMIQDLCKWHEFKDWRELMLNMVRVAHAAGPDGGVLHKIPASGFVPTEVQLAKCGKEPVCAECKDLGYLCEVHDA